MDFQNLQITGDISVKPLPHGYLFHREGPYEMIMIVGPTGSGKSSFIQALSPDSDLGIAKDQLDGYTQTVTAFELVNVKWKRKDRPENLETIYIVDTPGFSDSNISEIEIIHMLNAWMKAHLIRRIEAVIYTHRITDSRLPATKLRTIKMFNSLTKVETNASTTALTIATTMWDQIVTESLMGRALDHFEQLKNEIWKDHTKRGGRITKFTGTRQSSLEIIDTALGDGTKFLALGGPVSMSTERDYIPYLYQDLLDRIASAESAKDLAEKSLALEGAEGNAELIAIEKAKLDQASQTLEKFQRQLVDFGDPPPGFGHVLGQLPKENLSRIGRFRQGYHALKEDYAAEAVGSVKEKAAKLKEKVRLWR